MDFQDFFIEISSYLWKKSLTEDLAKIIARACKQPEIYALSAKFIVISQEREKQNTKKQLFSAAIICV